VYIETEEEDVHYEDKWSEEKLVDTDVAQSGFHAFK